MNVRKVFRENVEREARIYTDDAPHYKPVGVQYAEHQSVSHAAGEFYRREDLTIHAQTVENYYSIFKRGMRGCYQWCSRQHLHRYCREFDFRYSHRAALGFDDAARADALLKGTKGRRLTYKAAGSEQAGAQA